MAFLTSAFRNTVGKLPAVEIRVAVEAKLKGNAAVRSAGLVAGFAAHLFVLSLQGVAGFIMVKFGFRDASPAGGAVAGFAVVAKLPAVHILVAIRAAGKRNVAEFQKGSIRRKAVIGNSRVAILAGNKGVFTGQGIIGVIMVESRRRCPAIHTVAGKTFGAKLPAMLINMAAYALRAEAQKGTAQYFLFGEQRRGIRYVFRFVAFPTFHFDVSAFQLVAGKVVVEFLLAFFPANQVNLASLVFRMADPAFFMIRVGVQAFFSGNPLF